MFLKLEEVVKNLQSAPYCLVAVSPPVLMLYLSQRFSPGLNTLLTSKITMFVFVVFHSRYSLLYNKVLHEPQVDFIKRKYKNYSGNFKGKYHLFVCLDSSTQA